jgi:hypothetical protein
MTSYQHSTTFYPARVARLPSAWRRSTPPASIVGLTRLVLAALIVLAVVFAALDITLGYTLAGPVAPPVAGPGAGLGL